MQIANIFLSIDGEVNSFGQGTFTTFIRFSNCNLKCSYCDTKWAQTNEQAKEMSIDEILNVVKEIDCQKVTITGGEPLLQSDIVLLIDALKDNGFDISIETNGTILFPDNFKRVDCWIMDCKLHALPLKYNMEILRSFDFIKIPVWDRDSYETAKNIIKKYSCLEIQWAISAVISDKLNHAKLIEWMKTDKLFFVKVNVQLHKFIYPLDNTNIFNGTEH
jgi:7-carboxy-7-deazaguanine synthase